MQQDQASILGKVFDNEKNPLAYATIFIANSTIGTISDKNGSFQLNNIPFGQHILVVSFVGYETYKKNLTINKTVFEQNIVLTPSLVELELIEIVGRKSRNRWKSNFRKFRNYFIGTTPNANECVILNPEILRFHIDRESNILSATADDMLIIENRALGYTVQYVLELFELRPDGSNIYLGKEKFEPLVPQNINEEQKWGKNRKEAYNGSFRHFMSSLAENSLKKEGFLVIETNEIIPFANQKREENNPELTLSGGNNLFVNSTLQEYEKLLEYSSNYLHIRYIYESDKLKAMGYQRTIDKSQPYQESWMRRMSNRTIFHTDGYLYHPGSVMVYGYWAKEKIAEALPLDYFPQE